MVLILSFINDFKQGNYKAINNVLSKVNWSEIFHERLLKREIKDGKDIVVQKVMLIMSGT